MELVEISHELMAIANDALLYCKDPFDTERFKQVRSIAAKLLEMSCEGITKEQAQEIFEDNDGYQTPKIDTRAAVFNEREQVLLVKDYDGKWALPGGWCEYNTTIRENTIKEAREEAGLDVEPVDCFAEQHWHMIFLTLRVHYILLYNTMCFRPSSSLPRCWPPLRGC